MKIAFVLAHFGADWVGGANYYRSLFRAIELQPFPAPKVVVFTSPKCVGEAAKYFGQVEVVSHSMLERRTLPHLLRKAIATLVGRDVLLERLLRTHGISVCSHGPGLGAGSRIPSYTWIPDLQHLGLPGHFSPADIRRRNRIVRRNCRSASGIILSSQAAKRDLVAFLPGSETKIKVLHFVPDITRLVITPLPVLQERYGFIGDYVFLPNQYWTHKNHALVIRALGLLRRQGHAIQVISTGATCDYRSPDHMISIKTVIAEEGVAECYRILGLIPYGDMISLMCHSLALINPSRFEGWSTTVEEAKLLGKKLLLSDIPVHREQANLGALYFNPDSVAQCAEVLLKTIHASAYIRPFELNAKKPDSALQDFGRRYRELLNGD